MSVSTNISTIEYVRNRLRHMVNGDESVDISALLFLLNSQLPSIGGTKVELSPHESKPSFFTRIE